MLSWFDKSMGAASGCRTGTDLLHWIATVDVVELDGVQFPMNWIVGAAAKNGTVSRPPRSSNAFRGLNAAGMRLIVSSNR